MKYILIQGNGVKVKEIKKKLKKYNIGLIGKKRAELLPFYIFMNTIKYGKPEALIYRYLNDYRSLFRTIIRTISELISILLCKVMNINIVWINHNVDRESIMHYPKITNFRRKIMSKYSNKILVTDPLLTKYAKKIFPDEKKKIDYITFGEIEEEYYSEKSVKLTSEIKKFVEFEREKNDNVMIGLCAGNANWKTAHFELIPDLLIESEKNNIPIRMIVIGPLGKYYDGELISFLEKDERIFFVNEFIHLNEKEISDKISFIWRAYRDLSTPFTVYHAATMGKPILTYDMGFLEEAVRFYSLGYVLSEDFNNIGKVFKALKEWDSINAEIFLRTHNWCVSARKFKKITNK